MRMGGAVLLTACGDPVQPPPPPPPLPTTGSVMFWTDDVRIIPIAVQLGNQPVAVVSAAFSSMPPCGQAGAANYNSVAPGSYQVVAADAAGNRWSFVSDVKAGQCLAVRLLVNRSGSMTSVEPRVVAMRFQVQVGK